MGDSSSGATPPLRKLDSRVQVASGHLIYVDQNTLLARAFDFERLEFTGDAFPLGGPIPHFGTGWAPFAASRNGIVAYRRDRSGRERLVWRDRKGEEQAEALGPGQYGDIILSPHGTKLAIKIRHDPRNSGLYVQDLDTGIRIPLTAGSSPVWSSDELRIAYRERTRRVSVREVGRDDVAPQTIDESLRLPSLTDWSSDGKWIACDVWNSETEEDIWLLPASGEGKPRLRRGTRFWEGKATFSSNGQWLAYISNESGRYEVYVASVEGRERGECVSNNGGVNPRWGSDGELFYLSLDHVIHSVRLEFDKDGPTAGAPTPLFGTDSIQGFDVTENGERFLVTERVGPITPRPVEVIVNWIRGIGL